MVKQEVMNQTALQIRSMLQGFEVKEVASIIYEALRSDNSKVPFLVVGKLVEPFGGRKVVITTKNGEVNLTIKHINGETLNLFNW